MATYTELTLDQAVAMGAAFGLTVARVEAIPAGSVNSNYRFHLADGSWIFARVYEEQDQTGAEGEARLLDHLARHGVKTPRPMPRRDGSGFTYALRLPNGSAEGAREGTRAVALFPWSPGEILCQARVTGAVSSEVGRQLAKVHLAGASF